MSGSDETGRIVLSAAMPGVAFTIVDGTFQAVARGVGRLDVTLPHGLYEVATRAGGSVETQLVSLEPGEVWRRDGITAGVYGAAPLPGSLTASAPHAAAAEAASRRVASATGPAAGLVIVVRRLEPGATELHHEQLTLLDRSLEPVPGWPDWTADPESGIATAGARLEPGPYVLRLRQPAGHGPRLDQTVWLSEGWQTLVFCPNGTDRVPVEDASVHMGRLAEPFPGTHGGLAAAVEIATSGLRQGLPLVNADLLDLLRAHEFANPMLGIAGAHAQLLRPDGDLGDYCAVVSELRALLPDHPDVIALATHPSCGSTGLPSVWWPPMLGASYDRLLLPADRIDPAVIQDGSPAERVAGYVVQRGPWLCWEASTSVLEPPPAVPDETMPTKLLSATTVGATRRVQRHVRELADLTGNSQHQVAGSLGAEELAKRLDLPIATVRAVLAELGWDKVFLPIDTEEETITPVPRGDSPFAPNTVIEEEPPQPKPPEPRPPVPFEPGPVVIARPDRRGWWLAAGVLTAVVLVVVAASIFGGEDGGDGGGGGVSISAGQPGLFARTSPSDRTVEVTLSGNGDPQQVTATVDGDGFSADASACESVESVCKVRVSYQPDPKRLRDYRATLVLASPDADDLQVPLYGAAKPAQGEVRIAWRQVRAVRSGEAVTPYVEVKNVRLGPVQTVLTISIPDGFDLGTFADQCDTRAGSVVYCWVGLDEHHTVWPINVPLIARGSTGGALRVTAQVSVDPDYPDPDRADNTATVTIPVDAG